MKPSLWIAAPAVALALLGSTAARAGANDYAFEAVAPEMKKGDDVIVTLRLVHKPTGKAVPDAVIVRTRVDMAPDGMADMVSPVEVVPSKEPGTYSFKTDLPMPGRYQVLLSAKVQGEPDTVQSKVIVKAVK
ncbi:FixH family protein [Rhodoplanes azumiensis]|uniref:FixH family protein n=1 Tax=Rhodoplanes azumiensis TaxID=1897628 RepID=A0ABW5AH64_9BRAD